MPSQPILLPFTPDSQEYKSQDELSDLPSALVLNRERLATTIRLQRERILASNHLIAEARQTREKLVEERSLSAVAKRETREAARREVIAGRKKEKDRLAIARRERLAIERRERIASEQNALLLAAKDKVPRKLGRPLLGDSLERTQAEELRLTPATADVRARKKIRDNERDKRHRQ
jgi:hypothetical protein